MTDTNDEYLELHRQHAVGYTRAEVIAVLEGNMDEPPNESEAAVPSTDGAAMKEKYLLTTMYALIDEYGLLGVQRTLKAIAGDYGEEPIDG